MTGVSTTHLICTNCGSSDTTATIAAIIAAVSVMIAAVSTVATFRTARATSTAAAAAAQEANASFEAVKLSRQQNRRSQMPVVMPTANARGHTEADGMPKALPHDTTEPVVVIIPIRNVGSGPAFDIEASIEFLDAAGNVSSAGQPLQITPGGFSALGAAEAVPLRAVFRGLATPLLSFRVLLGYSDSFGGRYKSSAIYIEAEQTYRSIVFNPPRELDPSAE